MLWTIASYSMVGGLGFGFGMAIGGMGGVWVGMQTAELFSGMWSPLFSRKGA